MDTKSRIMETAFKLLLKKGFDNVSINEVKKESNITTGGFYHHFESKDTLMVEVIKKYLFNYFYLTMEQIKNFEGTPKEKLKVAILSIIGDDSVINETTQLVGGPEKIDYRTLHLLLIEGVQKYNMISEIYTEFFTNMFDFIKDVINEGIAQGVIRSDINNTIVSEVIETMMMGTVIMWIALPEKSMKERVETNINEVWEHIKN
ncbi:MAG: TetR/AcrR family transcriptional regulator [Methanobacteriaceae archaeon]|jgi:AcrR family transcriptional regulator|nr:TetR/AcrR family transcriptional regulator [Methanobacteriaceae archaeon]OPY22483.1 MAG: DNA-binding transcriptional repressor AcrR [Methanobacterium sp. PtaU1.Bin097]